MAYSRDEIKAITDKVLNMCKADAVEVAFSGGERSATRYANSSITANLIEHDQEVQITVYYGQKTATATTHQFDDASLKRTIEGVQTLAQRKPDNPEVMPLVKPPQNYIEIDAALPSAVNFGPAERAKMVKQSTDICEKKGVLGAGYIPKFDWVEASANSEGLFSYFHYADASFILTCRTPDQTGSGWAGTTGVKDIANIDAEMLTTVAADKALKSAKPRAIEPGNYTVILEPRPAARYLSLMLGSLNARAAEEGRSFMSGKERGQTRLGEKVFGDNFTLRSEIGNPILRQSPIGQDGRRVVLVFTDGVDEPYNFKGNNVSHKDAQNRAQRDDVMVYAVGLESRVPYGGRRAPLPGRGGLTMEPRMIRQKPDEGLSKIAAETGGGYFELTEAQDLRSAFSRVADELHRQYALGFEPTTLDGKVHKIEVRVRKSGLKARARKSYVAATDKP